MFFFFVISQGACCQKRASIANRRFSTVPCVQWAVTMPVMKLYRPLPDQESCTEGIVGTADALRVTMTREGEVRGMKEMRT